MGNISKASPILLLLSGRCEQSRALQLLRALQSETTVFVGTDRSQCVVALKLIVENHFASNQLSATPTFRHWGIDE